MKKVVINVCYGGFGLSSRAIVKYLKLSGKEAFFYVQTKYTHRDGKEEYTKIAEDHEEYFCRHMDYPEEKKKKEKEIMSEL